MFSLAGQGFINVSPTFVRCTTRMVVSLNFFQVNDYVVWCSAVALPSCYSYVIMTSEPFIVKMETWAVDTSLAQLSQARRPPCLVHKYVTGQLCHCQGEMGGSNREVSIVTKAIIMVSFIWASPLSLSFFFIYIQEALYLAAQWAARRVTYWWSLSTVGTKSVCVNCCRDARDELRLSVSSINSEQKPLFIPLLLSRTMNFRVEY